MLIRNNWTTPSIPLDKLNLSNAICYDKNLMPLIDIDNNCLFSYPNEYDIYHLLSQHFSIPIEHISLGYGLGELLPRIFSLFRHKHLKVVSPTWQLVELYCKTQLINYKELFYKNFTELDLAELYTGDSDIIYIANPNGINGQILTKEQIVKLCDVYELVIVDEAYGDYSDQSVIDYATTVDNLIVAKTFSKSLALPGLRTGFCVAGKNLTVKIQESRPGYIATGITYSVLRSLLPELANHVSRMNATRDYIESSYATIKSYSNSVLFKNIPNINCVSKEVYPEVYRMALVDIDTFLEIRNER